jgi:hypothetical protein
MNKVKYMVYYIDNEFDGAGHNAVLFEDDNSDGSALTRALTFMQRLREPGRGITFISMASESMENVGKMGVDSIVDNVCPDGLPFLGRLSRHGMLLKRGR